MSSWKNRKTTASSRRSRKPQMTSWGTGPYFMEATQPGQFYGTGYDNKEEAMQAAENYVRKHRKAKAVVLKGKKQVMTAEVMELRGGTKIMQTTEVRAKRRRRQKP